MLRMHLLGLGFEESTSRLFGEILPGWMLACRSVFWGVFIVLFDIVVVTETSPVKFRGTCSKLFVLGSGSPFLTFWAALWCVCVCVFVFV